MPLQIKNLALAAALALGGVTATDVVPVLQAQAEKEVQRDGGNLKLLRAAALKGQEVQRDAIPPFVPDTKRRDQNSGDAPFLGRQLQGLEKYIEPKVLVEKVFALEASEAKLEHEDEMLAQRISELGTFQEGLTGRVGGLEKLAPSISGLGSSLEVLIGRVDVLAPSVSVLQESQEGLTGRVDDLEELAPRVSELETFQEALTGRVDDLEELAPRVSELETSQAGLAGRVDVLIAQMEGLIGRVDNLENSSGEMTFAEARDRARAREEINLLSRYEFLSLIRLSDGPGRAALTRERTDYRSMFAGLDFASYDIMDIFYTSEWDDIYEKFGVTDRSLNLPGFASIKTDDLHLSEWQIPENALLGEMFHGCTNVPDLSNWILTDEYVYNSSENMVWAMFWYSDVTDESKCPCINNKRCCPASGAFNHGWFCEENEENVPFVRCGED